MAIVLLLFLVVVWAIVLGPSLLRRRARSRSTDSIGAFHRQLGILERTGPELMAPAHRLGPAQSAFVGPGRSGLIVVRPDAVPAAVFTPMRPTRPGRQPDAYFRPEACKRRRDVLLGLASSVVVTVLLGVVPGLQAVLVVAALLSVVLVAYVGLLVRLRNLALEREAKLRFLPPPVDHDAGLVIRRAAAR